MDNNTFIHKIIQRSNRNMFVLALVCIAIIGGSAWLAHNYLYNFFGGPFVLDGSDVLSTSRIDMMGPNQKVFVTLTGEDSLDTGYYQYHMDNGREVIDANYGVLAFGDQFLLVKTKQTLGDNPPREFTGALINVPDEVRREVISDIESEIPEIRGSFLPVMLDTKNFRTNVIIGLVVGGIGALITLWVLYMAVSRSTNIMNHPIMKDLSRFGDASSIVSQIDYESQHTQGEKVGNMQFTRSWAMVKGSTSFHATRFTDMMWIYKKVTQHRTNGIPTGKTFEILLWDRFGKSISIKANKNNVDDLLVAIYKHAPWMLAGFDQELDKAWRNQRSNVVAAVDQRRQQFMEQGTAQGVAAS